MQKSAKCEYGYLQYKRTCNLLKMLAGFAVILIVLFAGILIFHTRNNYLTVVAAVLSLPAAKFAVEYFILLPHTITPRDLKAQLEELAPDLTFCYDCIFSNNKKPIGALAVVVTDNCICAYSNEKKADSELFETSVKQFLENDKLHVNVTLYQEEKTFINRVKSLQANYDSSNEEHKKRVEWNKEAMKKMCL